MHLGRGLSCHVLGATSWRLCAHVAQHRDLWGRWIVAPAGAHLRRPRPPIERRSTHEQDALWTLLPVVVLSCLAVYALMYATVDSIANVYINLNQRG